MRCIFDHFDLSKCVCVGGVLYAGRGCMSVCLYCICMYTFTYLCICVHAFMGMSVYKRVDYVHVCVCVCEYLCLYV